ncbi:MAG: hypothetical protein R3D33_10280 [Hyphomicrobiaceae bacterium]
MSWLTFAGLAALAGMLAMIATASPELAGANAVAAVATGGALALIALGANLALWRAGAGIAPMRAAAVLNGRLMAVAYFWGGLAMAGMYYLTDLSWYHAYQYAIYMAALGALCLAMAGRIAAIDIAGRTRPLRTGPALAVFQGLVMAGIAIYLARSGKLQAMRPDWAANHVFLAGALALVAMSTISLASHHRLKPARG